MSKQSKTWNLVADIGGTNARFGVQEVGGEVAQVLNYAVADFASFDDALERLLGDIDALSVWCETPEATCFAVACPPTGDVIQFTNSHWRIDRARTASRLEQSGIDVINDFAAVGYAVSALGPDDWRQLGGGEAQAESPIAVFGPGTGLGVCSLVQSDGKWRIMAGEGGHADFAPVDDIEIEVMRVLRQRFGRVSYERLLSGSGIGNIYQALSEINGQPASLDSAAAISSAAIDGENPIARQSLDLFFAILGSVAGNLALTLGAHGGVYIAGGIVPRMVDFALSSRLRERFEAKGRFRGYLEPIPLRLILRPNLGLFGACQRLELASEPA